MRKWFLIMCIPVLLAFCIKPDWGFFGHRKINFLAVLTLPYELLGFFKSNITYVSEHAVDPDMRRYATKYEAMRHYIDIDMWDSIPFKNVPRDFSEAMVTKGQLYAVNDSKDSLAIYVSYDDTTVVLTINQNKLEVKKQYFTNFLQQSLMPTFYEDEMRVSSLKLNYALKTNAIDYEKYPNIVLVDKLSEHGILPYYLEEGVIKLSRAFKAQNKSEILRHAADLGHYVGDAHVPLHTTVNYNGQFTDQLGIHAFWESRIPELFAETDYDFMVGKAEYIPNLRAYIWDIIIDTHSKMPDVLRIEKELSKKFPLDQQYAFDVRLGQTVRLQSRAYCKAYQDAMQGMVEEQMTKSVKALGDFWLTAYVLAGKPDMKNLKNSDLVEIEKIITNPNIKTRDHEH